MYQPTNEHGFTAHIRTRGEEIMLKAHAPGWRARRCAVEACQPWVNRNRAILIRWSKTASTSPCSDSPAA